jgi:hypothetical protein
MPNDAIDRVNNLGARQGMPKTLTFADRYGVELLDDDRDIDDDHDSDYAPDSDSDSSDDSSASLPDGYDSDSDDDDSTPTPMMIVTRSLGTMMPPMPLGAVLPPLGVAWVLLPALMRGSQEWGVPERMWIRVQSGAG